MVIRQYDAFRVDHSDAAEIASRIVQVTANVLAADATISIYMAAAEGTEWESFWKEVLEVLWYAEPMEGGDGEENITLH